MLGLFWRVEFKYNLNTCKVIKIFIFHKLLTEELFNNFVTEREV
jgi:hypothetical protein